MKKKLLTIGILGMSISLSAQSLLSVGDKALMKVSPETLVYSGGSLRTKGSGVLDIYGNVIVKANNVSTDALETKLPDGITNKETGGNIILRLNAADNSRYGQLAIIGLSNDKITAIVDKEYRDGNHGSYQQIAMPFNGKQLSSLNSELGKVVSDVRYSKNEILTYNNAKVRSDVFSINSVISSATDYYMMGTSNGSFSAAGNPANTVSSPLLNPNSGINTQAQPYTAGSYVLRGKPFGDQQTVALKGAGAGIDFGVDGTGRNYYGEKYNSYLQDDFDLSSGEWKNPNFGKNLYQFGNPFLTNIDVKNIAVQETAPNSDGNYIPNIQGIRYDPGAVTSEKNGATFSTGAKYTTFAAGVPAGDIGMIIKPMQTFVVKLSNTAEYPLNFAPLRRFSYTPRVAGSAGGLNAKRAAGGSVKQLGVIALNENNEEMGRCYYVVYPNGKTGSPKNISSTQVVNSANNIIGTFEEDPISGGYDNSVKDSYWLYINEANEVDFKGKSIPLNLYSSDIKSLKFEIREDAELLDDGQQVLSTGKEFYYKVGDNEVVAIKNGGVVSVTEDSYGLFYDKPAGFLGNSNTIKPSRTKVVYNRNINDYMVVFDPNWNEANIDVYDASGKLIFSKAKVSTKNNFVIELQRTNGVYVVVATSEKGEVSNTKIIK